MEQFKRAQVIILPTGESNLSINRSYKDYEIGTEVNKPYLTYCKSFKYSVSVTDNSNNPQHLYIISDDEIKEGDYCLNISKNIIYQKDKLPMDIMWKKIIASTDTSCNYIIHDDTVPYPKGSQVRLPQPSQQFIEKYIEFYNKGEVITEVLVEYEIEIYNVNSINQFNEERLKINSKDNTITIKKLKDSWNREEVMDLLIRSHQGHSNKIRFGKNNSPFDVNKWIEENL